MLINLVNNALKFTNNGKIKIVVAFDFTEKKLLVHVVDNGIGISQSDLPRLFT